MRHHDSWRNGRLVAVQGACQVERELECHYRLTKGRRSRNGAASRTCHGVRKRRLHYRASPKLKTRAVGAERFLSRGSLVAFSGVDGSGKSTQIGLLQESFRNAGTRFVTIRCRWRPLLSFTLLVPLPRLAYAKVDGHSGVCS